MRRNGANTMYIYDEISPAARESIRRSLTLSLAFIYLPGTGDQIKYHEFQAQIISLVSSLCIGCATDAIYAIYDKKESLTTGKSSLLLILYFICW